MFRKIRDGLFGDSLLSRVMLLTSSSIMAHVIVIAALPVISRLFDPGELGLIAMVTAVINFLLPVVCLRYDGALPLAPRSSDAARLACLCLLGAALVGTLFVLGVFVLQRNGLLGFGELPDYSPWIVLAAVPGTAMFALGQAWWLRRRGARVIGGNLIARAAAQNGTRIGMGALGTGMWGLMVAEIAMACASFFMALGMPWRRMVRVLRGPAALWQLARQWRRFPLIEGPSMLLNSFVIVFLPVPLITMLYGIEAAGLFAIAVRIGSIPIGQIGKAIANATYMDFSKAARVHDYDGMSRLFYRMLKRLALFALLPMIAFAVLAPILAGPILGANWADSGLYLALLTPWFYAQLVVSPLSRIVSVLQRQDLKLIYDVSLLFAVVGAFFIARGFGLPVEQYLLVLSLMMALAYAIYFWVLRYALISRQRAARSQAAAGTGPGPDA